MNELNKLEYLTKECQKLINISNAIVEDKSSGKSIKICLQNKEYEILDEQEMVEAILRYVAVKTRKLANVILKEEIPKILGDVSNKKNSS